MAKSLKTDKLVETVKIRAMMPDHGAAFSDDDIIDVLNQEFDTSLLARVLDVHEEYFLYYEDQDYVSGTTQYQIPYRAIGNKLREVQLIDSSGTIYELSRIEVDDLPSFQDNFSFNRSNVFYIKNNYVVLPNTLSISQTGATVRMYFYLRPNELVANEDGGIITDINRDTGVITLDDYPDVFSEAVKFDFIAHRSPNKIYAYDIKFGSSNSSSLTVTFPVEKDVSSVTHASDLLTITTHGYYTGLEVSLSTTGTLPGGLDSASTYFVIKIDADTFKLATSLANAEAGTAIDITDAGTGTHTISPTFDHIPDELIEGDFLCLAEQTIVPQIPSELHTLLAQMAALVCVESVGDAQEVALVTKKLEKMEKNLTQLIDNRVEGAPQKFNPRGGILAQGRFGRKSLFGYN